MEMKETGWSYYIAEHGEDASDATPLRVYEWQNICDAKDAAEYAAEDEWNNRDGWDAGVGKGPVVTVVSTSGEEKRFATEREVTISHSAIEIAEWDTKMNLPAPKATAKLIIALTESHVEKAMSEGDMRKAMIFQSIISTLNLSLETGAPVEFK